MAKMHCYVVLAFALYASSVVMVPGARSAAGHAARGGSAGRKSSKRALVPPTAAKSAPAFSLEHEEAIAADVIERKLAAWKPTAENETTPRRTLLSTTGDISGTWRVSRGMDGSTLWIRSSTPGRYVVSFRTGGCLSRWTLKRHGQYGDGVLSLNKPVEEYFPLTYSRLYVLTVAGQLYLVPDASVRDFEKGVTADGSRVERQLSVDFYAYRQVGPPSPKR